MHMNQKNRRILLAGAVCMAVIVIAAVISRRPGGGEQAAVTPPAVEGGVSPSVAVMETAPPEETEDPTESIATFLQGPKSWKARREWSGEWGKTYYDGRSFGAFGCGLCCTANIYCSLTDYRCSPVDMYDYTKKVTGYGGGGAVAWGYMKGSLVSAGFTCEVGRKPDTYEEFQRVVGQAQACIVVVSSNDSDCYWKDTPGHYVTLFLYDPDSDRIFLADSGDPDHNRQWVPLKKIYRSLKTANDWQYMAVTGYDEKKDQWKHSGIGGNCVLPEKWRIS